MSIDISYDPTLSGTRISFVMCDYEGVMPFSKDMYWNGKAYTPPAEGMQSFEQTYENLVLVQNYLLQTIRHQVKMDHTEFAKRSEWVTKIHLQAELDELADLREKNTALKNQLDALLYGSGPVPAFSVSTPATAEAADNYVLPMGDGTAQ